MQRNVFFVKKTGEFKAAPRSGADLNSISDARISEADSESNDCIKYFVKKYFVKRHLETSRIIIYKSRTSSR